MAMITCNECGKEYSDKAEKCPNCACPNELYIDHTNVITVTKGKGYWSTGRLTIGIISIVLFFLVSFQSCAAGFSNAIQNNNSTSGSSGMFLSFCLLLSGIVGICTRNSKSKMGPIITCIFYLLGALLTVGTGSTYGDLPIWGGLSFIFGIVFAISAVKTKKEYTN